MQRETVTRKSISRETKLKHRKPRQTWRGGGGGGGQTDREKTSYIFFAEPTRSLDRSSSKTALKNARMRSIPSLRSFHALPLIQRHCDFTPRNFGDERYMPVKCTPRNIPSNQDDSRCSQNDHYSRSTKQHLFAWKEEKTPTSEEQNPSFTNTTGDGFKECHDH